MSIRNRLTLGFFLITLAAIAVVFLYVAPTREDRLRDEKLDQMRSAVERHADTFEATIGTDLPVKAVQRLVADVSQQVNARVTLLTFLGPFVPLFGATVSGGSPSSSRW